MAVVPLGDTNAVVFLPLPASPMALGTVLPRDKVAR